LPVKIVIGSVLSANSRRVRIGLRALTAILLLMAIVRHGFINVDDLFNLAAYPTSIVLTGLAIILLVPLLPRRNQTQDNDSLAVEYS